MAPRPNRLNSVWQSLPGLVTASQPNSTTKAAAATASLVAKAMTASAKNNFWEDFANLTDNLDCFISSHCAEDSRAQYELAYKRLYDGFKCLERRHPSSSSRGSALAELLMDNFTDEQIWQQIELQNENSLLRGWQDVSKVAMVQPSLRDTEDMDGEEEEVEKEEEDMEEVENEEEDGEDLFSAGKWEEDDEEDAEEKASQRSKGAPRSVVDDDFFSLHEMERFADKEEIVDPSGVAELFTDDLFREDPDDQGDSNIRYKDFFAPPSNVNRKVRFADGTKFGDGEEEEQMEEEQEAADESVEEEHEGVKSSFELRRERMNIRIQQMEEENLAEKPWQLGGETSSQLRPENSLLEEQLLFDRATKLPPVITPETTVNLESMIKRRVKDKAWDDVERKAMPVLNLGVYKNELILDQQKSKLSLSEIYEQEYLKKTQKLEEEQKNPAHEEIRKAMKDLFFKLDAITNFHYTPRPPVPDFVIVNNLPSIAMEEVAPVTASDATILAPEEVKKKQMHEPVAPEELSKADKKRLLRKKKKRQSIRSQRERAKATSKGFVVPKDKMELLGKVGTVKKTQVFQWKKSMSSTAFFDKLQTEVKVAKDDIIGKTNRQTATDHKALSSAAYKL